MGENRRNHRLGGMGTSRGRVLALFAVVGVVVGGIVVAQGLTSTRPIPRGSAQSPPMGFNNWTATYCGEQFNEAMIKGIADAMVSKGLKGAGYEYVNLDDCWALPQRNTDGDLVPDRGRFPNGIKALADYVHDKGMKFGIYTSAGTKTCDPNGFPGALGHEGNDAAQFAEWGVDLVKYDNCNNEGVNAEQRYRTMRDALDATGRPIVLSICEWGQNQPWQWADGIGQMWRTGGDIEDNWSSVLENLNKNLATTQFSGPGQWSDPDLLQVGNGGMSDEQYRSQFSLWSMMAAPLIIGSDLREASPTTLATVTNPEVIAVDQDPLGISGHEIMSRNGARVIAKPLAGGDIAVALFNENATPTTIDADLNDAGLNAGRYIVRDLWSKATRVATVNVLETPVPGYATIVFRVSPMGPRPAGRWSLSDLLASSSSNGWGPIQVDRSNGEELGDDGRTLSVRGAMHAQGLGVHAPSEVSYYLGGTCSTLTTTVGIDDEVHGTGSVDFQIFADGALVSESGLMGTTTPAKTLTADLAGAYTVKLVVTDAGDGIEFDHADWADPVLECS